MLRTFSLLMRAPLVCGESCSMLILPNTVKKCRPAEFYLSKSSLPTAVGFVDGFPPIVTVIHFLQKPYPDRIPDDESFSDATHQSSTCNTSWKGQRRIARTRRFAKRLRQLPTWRSSRQRRGLTLPCATCFLTVPLLAKNLAVYECTCLVNCTLHEQCLMKTPCNINLCSCCVCSNDFFAWTYHFFCRLSLLNFGWTSSFWLQHDVYFLNGCVIIQIL